MATSIVKNNYSVGQEIKLKSGFTGVVISICHFGHKDIRPPYHRTGVPHIKGTGKYLGYINLIPEEWDDLYNGEVKETELCAE